MSRRTMLAFVVWMGILIAAGAAIETNQGGGKPTDMLIAVGYAAGFLLFAFVVSLIVERDLYSAHISIASGRAQTKMQRISTRGGSMMIYILKIGRKRFDLISETALEAFEPGREYRVYYIRRGKLPIILSAEQV
jgi:hypothetical protein